jgi:flagellar biosynthesis activator protein FlaF
MVRNTSLARRAYETSAKSTGTPRSVEYNLFLRLTSVLSTAEENRTNNHSSYIDALSWNLELWTTIGADVSSSQNALPASLRGQLFYLFEFTQHHTKRLLNGDTSLSAEPLIEINRNIMTGLNVSVSE